MESLVAQLVSLHWQYQWLHWGQGHSCKSPEIGRVRLLLASEGTLDKEEEVTHMRCVCVCVCVFESLLQQLPVEKGGRECVHCTLSQ